MTIPDLEVAAEIGRRQVQDLLSQGRELTTKITVYRGGSAVVHLAPAPGTVPYDSVGVSILLFEADALLLTSEVWTRTRQLTPEEQELDTRAILELEQAGYTRGDLARDPAREEALSVMLFQRSGSEFAHQVFHRDFAAKSLSWGKLERTERIDGAMVAAAETAFSAIDAVTDRRRRRMADDRHAAAALSAMGWVVLTP